MKKRCIFSLLIKIDKLFSNSYKEKKSFNIMYNEKYPIYYEYFDKIKNMQSDYAKYCGADYIFFEKDNEYYNFEKEIRRYYKTPTTYDVIQYYKIFLCEKLSEEYDEVIYLDFDVLIGHIKKNFFDEWNFEKGLIIKNDYHDITNYIAKKGDSSRLIKSYLANEVCKKINFELSKSNVPHMNTGVIGCNKTSISNVNFFKLLPYMIETLEQKFLNKEENHQCVRYSNEIIFTLSYLLYQYPIQPILGEYNIWHKKANGDNDLNSVFLHCTGKKWIEKIFENI